MASPLCTYTIHHHQRIYAVNENISYLIRDFKFNPHIQKKFLIKSTIYEIMKPYTIWILNTNIEPNRFSDGLGWHVISVRTIYFPPQDLVLPVIDDVVSLSF